MLLRNDYSLAYRKTSSFSLNIEVDTLRPILHEKHTPFGFLPSSIRLINSLYGKTFCVSLFPS